MKSSLILVATGAVLASAGSVEKRAVVTNVVYQNVVVTETVYAAAPTPAAPAPVQQEYDADAVDVQDPEPEPEAYQVQEPEPEPQVEVVATPTPQVVYNNFKQQAKKPSKSASQQDNSQLGSFESTILNYHNDKRALHGAGAMTWNATLAQLAQDKANTCDGENHNNNGYGQNLAAMTTPYGKGDGSSSAASYATMAAEMWYSEGKNYGSSYGQPSPVGGPVTGHFTQMIWKGSNSLGCAIATGCLNRRRARGLTLAARAGKFDTVVVCNYFNQGNIVGYYAQNVSPSANGQ